jgi:hypothetical protein
MSEEVQQRQLRDAHWARVGAERYQRRQRELRSGRTRARDGARPREFDESGFPIPQRNPSFIERVARLLNPV